MNTQTDPRSRTRSVGRMPSDRREGGLRCADKNLPSRQPAPGSATHGFPLGYDRACCSLAIGTRRPYVLGISIQDAAR
jgi:hypothetical protein